MRIKSVLLVEPYGNIHWVPLSAAYLLANFTCDAGIHFLDCNKQHLPSESPAFLDAVAAFRPDLVGVSALTSTHPEALRVLQKVKEMNPGIITVMGGVHVTVYPHSTITKDYVDFVFRGESEHTFPLFVDRLNRGVDVSDIPGLVTRDKDNGINREQDLDKTRMPDYRVVLRQGWLNEGELSYGTKAPLWFTRGCPYRCKFCSAPVIHGNEVRKNSLEYAMENISHLYSQYGARHFSFIDDNITYDQRYLKELTRRIIAWRQDNTVEDAIFDFANGVRMQFLDDELLSLLKQAGWQEIFIAPESGSRRTLERMKKSLDPDIVPDITKRIKRAGLRVGAGFIIGYPGETRQDVKETQKLIRRCALDTFLIQQFCPLPGTPVFDELVARENLDAENPPSTFFLQYFAGKTAGTRYVTEGLKDFNFRRFFLAEMGSFALRNPKFLVNTIKSGRFVRFLRHARFFGKHS